ncbi:E3 ubiquitin-protein ligase [Oopsacas minuta]|uniref:E3 ubiquitin-protein ligase n=1 Tax=Oopsacas minuta TaxID=111878 RepID=A0AAV7JRB0_9METZ|nr:E3 ubiquitin-protein ligase [Oopsacas minuta]
MPLPHEVLICSEQTTFEEIDIFWRRSLMAPSCSDIFCLAFIENLKYDIAVRSVTSLKNYLNFIEKTQFLQLVLLCSSESENSSYMATALVKFKRTSPQLIPDQDLKEFIFKRTSHIRNSTNVCPYIPLKSCSIIDPDKSCVRIVSSNNVGSGKSLTVSRLVSKFIALTHVANPNSVCTVVTISESEDCEHKAATKLIGSPLSSGDYGRICHFDITATSCEHLIPFLFKLLITGMLCDKNGRIWRCSKRNYLVLEITLSSQSPEILRFLSLFPDWKCLEPNEVIDYMKLHNALPSNCQISLIDEEEVQSPEYQRIYAYFRKLETKGSRNFDEFTYKPSIPLVTNWNWKIKLDILTLFMKYYSLPMLLGAN